MALNAVTGAQEGSLVNQLAIEGINVTSENVADTLAPDMPGCNSHNCGHACSACGRSKSGVTVGTTEA